ncbi:HIT family protein [Microlunatus flavus]|uniref:Histidine triad (HIT) family protein n=1 Tax=Microlunatus flavus TaxID=1036181 RepID=A0A1H9MST3_9ACTN|nr:HIT domain-containing protein [Microlunatus flavus]SER26732.1 histidine triad (HIT) family protein [Microlunatus flavus]
MSPSETDAGTGPDASSADCIFCAIVAGTIPSRQVYADEAAVAFLDINGWHRGHTLVIPRRHVADLVSGEPTLPAIAPAIDAVARLLKDRLAPDGFNVLSSAGPVAGQTVFHAHVHVIPRYADQPGFTHLVDPSEVPAAELDAVWAEITGGTA